MKYLDNLGINIMKIIIAILLLVFLAGCDDLGGFDGWGRGEGWGHGEGDGWGHRGGD